MKDVLLFISLFILVVITSIGRSCLNNNVIDDTRRYKTFFRELNSDMDRYNIDEGDQQKIQSLVQKIVDDKKNTKNASDYINCMESGLIKGCIYGYLLGNHGLVSAATSAVIYSTVNPLILYLGY